AVSRDQVDAFFQRIDEPLVGERLVGVFDYCQGSNLPWFTSILVGQEHCIHGAHALQGGSQDRLPLRVTPKLAGSNPAGPNLTGQNLTGQLYPASCAPRPHRPAVAAYAAASAHPGSTSRTVRPSIT